MNEDVIELNEGEKSKEHFRIGVTDDGRTTLTLISDSGYTTMTLTMTEQHCERLIRMLRSTYQEENDFGVEE